jgi:hypothetical protein
MRQRTARILSAAASPMLPRYPQLSESDRSRVLHGLDLFLVEQVFAMPRYMLMPYLVALEVFEILPILRRGRPFSSLAAEDRGVIVARWSSSPLGPMRDLLKLIRSCALLYYLDHPIVERRLEEEAGRMPRHSSEGEAGLG